MAVELSKIYPIHEIPHRFQINKDRILFPGTDRRFHANRCSWRDDKAALYYCEKANLKFEAFLPGNYLTRYSVQCPHCYKNEESCFHLYCSYCDEVLKGSIAKPSGKISDHVITIRHVYQQALAIKDCLERDTLESSNIFMSWKYIVKLAEWSERVRYSTQASVKQIHLDKVLKELNQLLERHRPPQALMMVRRSPAAPLLWKTLRLLWRPMHFRRQVPALASYTYSRPASWHHHTQSYALGPTGTHVSQTFLTVHRRGYVYTFKPGLASEAGLFHTEAVGEQHDAPPFGFHHVFRG